jgi:PAS domain S-box-containing protein
MSTQNRVHIPGNEYEVMPGADLLVLIIDGNAADRQSCIRALSRSGGTRYRFVTASNGLTGLQAIADHAPDLVLLEYLLPGGNGLEVLEKISEQYPLLPVIILAAQGDEVVAARGIKAGAIDYFNKSYLLESALARPPLLEAATVSMSEVSTQNDTPGAFNSLHEAIRTAMSERRRTRKHSQVLTHILALIIDDNPLDREACIRALRRESGVHYRFVEAVDGPSGLEALAAQVPDVLLLDYSMPGSDGLEILPKIRDSHPFLPVIMLTGNGSEALAVRCIKAGAADYMTKSALSGIRLHRSIVAAIDQNRDARTIDQQSRTIQRQREHLEHSNHFLHSLLDHIPDPIFVKNGAHRWLLANRAFCELVGASGLSLADSGRSILPPDSVEAFWAQDDLALHSGEPLVSEQTIADQGGSRRLFSIKRATFSDHTGDRVLVGVMRDITSQRQSEDEFKLQAEQLVSQSQDLANLGAILEESLQEIFIVEAETLSILQANKGARRNLGYALHEIEKLHVLEVTPQFTERQLRKILEPLETGEVNEAVYHAAFRRKNGSLYDVEVHTQAAISNGCKAFIQIALDETERKRVEQLKGEFISKVSHELRTPLTSIRGALGLMQSGAVGELPEKAVPMVRIANSNAERLTRLVDDILALEKSISGKLTLHICELPVAETLRQAIESHAGYAERYKVRFVLDEAPSSSVMADSLRLTQVLSNLMSNAAKFSQPGAQVTVRARENGPNIRFEVEDNGCGIPEHFQPLIFEKFAQADSSTARRFEGTGLGLSITKELVEAMGGQIGFESHLERGTTFFFELPRPAQPQAATHDAPAGTHCHSASVLICEDDPDMSLIIKMAIEQAGFETTIVATLREAAQKLKEMTFSAMTLDLNLPDGDGLDFLKHLRSQPDTRRMPVVVVSASAVEARQNFTEESPLVDWLAKPLDQQTLVQSIRAALQRGESLLRLLYVGGEGNLGNELAHLLTGAAQMMVARDLSDCYREIRTRHFDLLILDPALPQEVRQELLDHVSSGAEDMPRVLVLADSDLAASGHDEQQVATDMLNKVRSLAVSESARITGTIH